MIRWKYPLFAVLMLLTAAGLLRAGSAQAGSPGLVSLAQQPTLSIPTVTSSPSGAYIQVNGDQDQINVRTGPGTDYSTVGILMMNQRAPAIGRCRGYQRRGRHSRAARTS